MVRSLPLTVILVGSAVLVARVPAAEPQEPAMPPAATAILGQMDKEIAATKMKAIVSLDKVLKDTTKKGDLAGAVAVKEVIDQLRAETQPVQNGRPGGGRMDGRSLVGTWSDGYNNVILSADGSCTSVGRKAQWKVNGNTVELKWDFGQTYRLAATPEGLVGVRLDAAGKELGDVRLTRVP